MNKMIPTLLSGILAISAYAQPAPGPEGGPPDGPPQGQRDRGGREGGPRDGGMREGGPGMQRGDRPDGMGPGGMGGENMGGMRRADPFDRMRGYLEVVDRYAKLSQDPTATAIAAVVAANDILRPRGTEAAVAFFTKALEEQKNAAVQRAIRLQLVDLYKVAGQQDKALEQLSELIKSAPAQ